MAGNEDETVPAGDITSTGPSSQIVGKNGPVTFDGLRDVLTPPGTDQDALWRALKAAKVTGGRLPGRFAPDISGSGSAVPDVARQAFPRLAGDMFPPPTDPLEDADLFAPGFAADVALGEMYNGMLRGGIPLASAERIIGVMLAEMPQPGQVMRDWLARLEDVLDGAGVDRDTAARVIRRMEAPGAA
jgi:hypothetical protein